jgi:membrane protease subunit (stomatin/prohibitin family)
LPLFEGHQASGLERLFIEIPDNQKGTIAYKWPDQQIIQHSLVNVDLDYEAVFTNLGRVIGVLGPGRHPLDEGASLSLGWLVDRLTANAYYDAELYFITTRDITNQRFGGPVDNITDGPTGLVVSLRVFGELAFRVTDPSALLARLMGTGAVQNVGNTISTWVTDQALAAIRAVLPDLVLQHGVLAMGQLQDATATAAGTRMNGALAPYGLQVTTFAQLNVNLPDDDAQQIKQFAAAKAYTGVAGDFNTAVRGQAALEIAHGVEAGNVGAQPAIIAAGLMGTPMAPVVGSAPPVAVPLSAPAAGFGPRYCTQCGQPLPSGAAFCPHCGTQIGPTAGAPQSVAPPVAPPAPPPPPPPPVNRQPPAPGYWLASDGNWYPPTARPGP